MALMYRHPNCLECDSNNYYREGVNYLPKTESVLRLRFGGFLYGDVTAVHLVRNFPFGGGNFGEPAEQYRERDGICSVGATLVEIRNRLLNDKFYSGYARAYKKSLCVCVF
jgi:hypothetical protein